MPDSCASDLSSIPGKVCQFFENFILLNSSNWTRIMKKLECSTVCGYENKPGACL